MALERNARLILVVEDNPDDVLLLQRAFVKASILNPVHVLSDGESAVAYLEGTGEYADRLAYPLPSVILLDLKMPRLSGLEVLARIRDIPEVRKIPTVMLTSSREESDVSRAYDLGANSYIVKSERVLEMVQAVRQYWLHINEPPLHATRAQPPFGER